jgi:predicted transcriptional regulator
MALPTDQQEIITITFVVWIVLMVISLVRSRRVPVESKQNEFPKLMILALSVAGAFTLGVTVVASVYFPDFLQSASSAALVVSGFMGAAISLWWTSATFWRELAALTRSRAMTVKLETGRTGGSVGTEEPDFWNLRILHAVNEKGQLKLSEIADETGMNERTTIRRVDDIVAKGWIIRFHRLTGTYYSLTMSGKVLLGRYGSELSRALHRVNIDPEDNSSSK